MEPGIGDPKEHSHFREVCAAIVNYQVDAVHDVYRSAQNFQSVKPEHLEKLPQPYTQRIERLRDAISENFFFFAHLIHPHRDLFEHTLLEDGRLMFTPMEIPPRDISKVRSTLRQIVRDWSAFGQAERDCCYVPVLAELDRVFPKPHKADGSKLTVLVPGAGLGRLSYEIAVRGFASQGNEFSYFMLLTSDYLLNKTVKKEQFTIYPFIHNTSNVLKFEEVFRPVTVPDVCPCESIPEDAEYSMVAGDFLSVYASQKEAWDCIVTCFFVDTANNIFEYIQTIHDCLVPGGVWINFGPLLYHYADVADQMSVELSWEEFRHVVLQFGFVLEQESFHNSSYASDANPLLQMTYKCIFFTARKPAVPSASPSPSSPE